MGVLGTIKISLLAERAKMGPSANRAWQSHKMKSLEKVRAI